ncbi:hypothetical protein ArV1_038 [Arthrobacter phage vB_ArtM-ArV1]|uniref:Uncharacterized protein n=1 Tax=Arthrobacter phage vB_ArtM-ArV1 TaxID=1566993 RepID=A0A0A7HBT8_9CAUD|nr:hypothetical protein ArV1_038 [Arthrobacter phage vB_ArtM-ArV1]AIZ01726.1 hypothetical protein ArV1_038 [Arthrobacter phage vB_ArtM-ArV1]
MSAPWYRFIPPNRHKKLPKEVTFLDPIQAAHMLPKLTREQGKAVVLESLRMTYEVLPADAPIEQTARAVAMLLQGDVSARELEEAYSLWLLRTQIADPNGDLEWLLDLPNTEANREAEQANAEGNLMASINAILDKAGVK